MWRDRECVCREIERVCVCRERERDRERETEEGQERLGCGLG